MITNKSKFILLLTFLIASLAGFSSEQDNWYIANEWTVTAGTGVAYYEDNNTGIGQIYICNGSSTSSKISVYDLNGSKMLDVETTTISVGDTSLIQIEIEYVPQN